MMSSLVDKKMYPFVKYPGGKTKEIPLVLKNLPLKINRYIEPFVGGGSIYFAMNMKESLINDKSRDLYDLYILVKEQNKTFKNYLNFFNECWEKLSTAEISSINFEDTMFSNEKLFNYYKLAKNKKNKTINVLESNGHVITSDNLLKIDNTAKKTAFYMLIRELYNTCTDKILHTACYYFLREYCYSSMFRFSKKGDFNVPYGGMSYNDKYLTSKINYMFSNEMKNYMLNTIIENEDFETFIININPKVDDFIFLDPPYDTDFSTYDNISFDKNEQIRLKNCLKKQTAKWMLIIKKTDFIYDLYKEFNIYEYDMNYMVSFKNRNDKDVKHLLITNYKLNTEV